MYSICRYASNTKGFSDWRLQQICNELDITWGHIQELVRKAEERDIDPNMTILQKEIAWERVENIRNYLEDTLNFLESIGLYPTRDYPWRKGKFSILSIAECEQWENYLQEKAC